MSKREKKNSKSRNKMSFDWCFFYLILNNGKHISY